MSTDEHKRPTTGPRVLAAVVAIPLSLVAAKVGANQIRNGFDAMGGLMFATFAACALLGWWFAACGWSAAANARMRGALTTGLILGTIGFLIGFIGPMFWAPDANQGPLIGIFITGPFGFLVGLVAGWIAPGLLRRRSE